jgi:hypothetical protein
MAAPKLFYANGNKLMAVEVNGDGEPFRAGVPKELFKTALAEPRRNRFEVSLDGKRFLANVPVEQNRASFSIVLSWPALPQR